MEYSNAELALIIMLAQVGDKFLSRQEEYYDLLLDRYDTSVNFKTRFRGYQFDTYHIDTLMDAKDRFKDKCDVQRQRLLKLLGRHENLWRCTNSSLDEGIFVCKFYANSNGDYLAFMKVIPGGFRSEQVLKSGVTISFYMLLGSALFYQRNFSRLLVKGRAIKISSNEPYSLRTKACDQTCYLFLKVVDQTKRYIVIEDSG